MEKPNFHGQTSIFADENHFFWEEIQLGSKAQLFGALLGRVPDAALRRQCHSCRINGERPRSDRMPQRMADRICCNKIDLS